MFGVPGHGSAEVTGEGGPWDPNTRFPEVQLSSVTGNRAPSPSCPGTPAVGMAIWAQPQPLGGKLKPRPWGWQEMQGGDFPGPFGLSFPPVFSFSLSPACHWAWEGESALWAWSESINGRQERPGQGSPLASGPSPSPGPPCSTQHLPGISPSMTLSPPIQSYISPLTGCDPFSRPSCARRRDKHDSHFTSDSQLLGSSAFSGPSRVPGMGATVNGLQQMPWEACGGASSYMKHLELP